MRSPLVLLCTALAAAGCAKSDDPKAVTAAPTAALAAALFESAVNEAGAQAGAVDGSSVSPLDYGSFAACAYATARSACAANVATVNWNGCALGTATVTGVVTETYSGFGATVCALNGHESTVKRVIDSASPRTVTLASGATLTTDQEPGTAFDGTSFPDLSQATTVQRLESGTSNGLTCATGAGACHNIVIRGLHTVLTAAGGAKTAESILTANISFQGSKSAGTRTMSGAMNVWRQSVGAKAVHALNGVKWGSASCCYPTEGTVVATITGSAAGSATMTFTATCGRAQVSVNGGTAETHDFSACAP